MDNHYNYTGFLWEQRNMSLFHEKTSEHNIDRYELTGYEGVTGKEYLCDDSEGGLC